jgi:hypothetical protein
MARLNEQLTETAAGAVSGHARCLSPRCSLPAASDTSSRKLVKPPVGISRRNGVAEANVSGAKQPTIRVRVNPVAIASMGINLEDVRLAIINANATGPLGVFDSDSVAWTIGTNTQMRDPREYRDIVVKSANGAVTLLGSIATIEQSTRNSRSASWFNRRPAVLTVAKAGRRQRDRDGQPHSSPAAGTQALGAPRHSILGALGPHSDDPRQRA